MRIVKSSVACEIAVSTLPLSVEQYLLESGFSTTEILIIKHLLSGGAMTLRELAAKTGKSTGVLDSASKKLVTKGILGREMINDAPKLTMSSPEAIVDWVQEDRARKAAALARQEKDLQAFVASLSADVSRADIQHYEGLPGMERAYEKLLQECGGTMLHFLPVRTTEVDEPLRDFLVQYFRDRRRRGVITRVIAHDTPLGRRYQSRDMFEYRQTLLVAEDRYAFATEKVIAGDWVGNFNHEEQRAFLIRSHAMAESERAFFEGIWNTESARTDAKTPSQIPTMPDSGSVERKTRIVSGLREFFLSRKSIGVFILFSLLSAIFTFFLYAYTKNLEFHKMQDTVRYIAEIGAMQFDARGFDALQTEEDWKKPEWNHVISQLETIRKGNEHLLSAYLFRKMESDPKRLEFIADSHSRFPFANTDDNPNNDIDIDADGVIDPAGHDKLKLPGQEYLFLSFDAFEGFERPTVTREMYKDTNWKVLSGFAPIRDENGMTSGVIGVEMRTDLPLAFRFSKIITIVYFLIFFILLICIRFGACNKSLLKEIFSLAMTKTFLMVIGVLVLIFVVASYVMYLQTLQLIKDQTAQRLKAIASTTAMQIDYRDLEVIHVARDMRKPEYQRVFKILNKIKRENIDVKWAYILRQSKWEGMLEFVVDANANFYTPSNIDYDLDGKPDSDVVPGVQYAISQSPDMIRAFDSAIAAVDVYSDPWGTYISGFAPILAESGKSVAIVGFDIDISNIIRTSKHYFIKKWIIMNVIGAFVIISVLLLKSFSSKRINSRIG